AVSAKAHIYGRDSRFFQRHLSDHARLSGLRGHQHTDPPSRQFTKARELRPCHDEQSNLVERRVSQEDDVISALKLVFGGWNRAGLGEFPVAAAQSRGGL